MTPRRGESLKHWIARIYCDMRGHRWIETRLGVRDCVRCGAREWLGFSRFPEGRWS